MRDVDMLLKGGPEIGMVNVVNYRDVGGMTPLHRAARLGSTDLVPRLMDLKADAHSATYPSRSPGNWTTLLCRVEADMSVRTSRT